MAWPPHAIVTGVGKLSNRIASSSPPFNMLTAGCPLAINVFKSKPAERIPLRPVSTTGTFARSASSSAAFSASCMARDIAFALPSSIVMTEIPSTKEYVANPVTKIQPLTVRTSNLPSHHLATSTALIPLCAHYLSHLQHPALK